MPSNGRRLLDLLDFNALCWLKKFDLSTSISDGLNSLILKNISVNSVVNFLTIPKKLRHDNRLNRICDYDPAYRVNPVKIVCAF